MRIQHAFKNHFPFVFVIIALIGLLTLAGCYGGDSGDGSGLPGDRQITGRIVVAPASANRVSSLRAADLSGHVPAVGAEVWLADLPTIPHVFTDASGTYTFFDIPAGEHTIVCSYLGSGSTVVMRNRLDGVVVGETGAVKAADFPLLEATNIAIGLLRDENGRPLPANTPIRLWGLTFYTTDGGRFTTPPLPAGFPTADLEIVLPGQTTTLAAIPFVSSVAPALIEVTIITGQTGTNAPPRVTMTATRADGTTGNVVNPSQEMTLVAHASDADTADQSNLQLAWQKTAGTLTVDPGDPTRATWKAMDRLGMATITVTVTDPQGATASMRLPMLVGIQSPAGLDVTQPTIVSRQPATDATGVPTNSSVVVIFSEPVQVSTVTAASFLVKQGQTSVAGAVSVAADGRSATFQPTQKLTPDTLYTVQVTADVQDPSGNSLAAEAAWSFRVVNVATTYSFAGHLGEGKGNWWSGVRPNGDFRGLAVDGTGNFYVTDATYHRVIKLSPSGSILTIWGTKGDQNGEFNTPWGVAVDSTGNVYVVDKKNHRVQKFTSEGGHVHSWGNQGFANGQFLEPTGIAADSAGNIYVADTSNHRIQKFTSAGAFVTKWGTWGAGDGQFNSPYGIAIDSSDKIYVADTSNHRIQTFDSAGNFVTKWGSTGAGDGQFSGPKALAIDGSGNIYVADTDNNRIQKFDSAGVFLTKWGTNGAGDGQFYEPCGVSIDGSGNVCIAETYNHRIQKFTSTGAFVTKWGTNGAGDGQFNNPFEVAIDGSGNIYVADTYNHRIQKFTAAGAFITKWGTNGTGDGQFSAPYGVAFDGSGNVYVADTSNHRIQKFTSTGVFVTKWGMNGAGDGQFNQPAGLAIDDSGNVYVVDNGNSRIQKFTAAGAFITKWGTNGAGDGQFSSPIGLAVDSSGDVYVVENGNNRIQKFTAAGAFITKWGTLGAGDGQLRGPAGLAVDSDGNVIVADTYNHRIQKFTSTGVLVTKWGSLGSGEGGFNNPFGVAVDSDGNVFVADTQNHSIEKFTR